jgi:Clp amino terminal domain, pathogenicity island component
MFERFTDRARRVIVRAQEEARNLNHNYIGTELILLGLIREGEGVAAQILVALGADLARVRQAVVQVLAGGEEGGGRTWTMTQSEEARGSFVAENAEPRYFPVPRSYTPRDGCSFCGRDLWDLGYAVAGTGAVNCEECITAAGEAVSRGRSQSRPQGELLHLAPRATGPVPDPDAVSQIQDAFAAVFGGVSRTLPTTTSWRMRQRSSAPASSSRPGLPRHSAHDARRAHSLRNAGPSAGPLRDHAARPGHVPVRSSAVRRGEQWMVSRETWCHVTARGGVQCPPREE